MSNKTFLLRHYDRIDQDPEKCPKEVMRNWNSKDRKEYIFRINPYLCCGNRVEQTTSYIKELDDICFDYVFCSPFLRCIETAIQIMDSTPSNFMSKNIFIDFNLSEIIDTEVDFFVTPLDIKTIYDHSKSYLSDNNSNFKNYTLVDHNTDLKFEESESEEKYEKRISNIVKSLREKYGGNILIVTHGYAIKSFNPSIRKMEHGPLYDITAYATGGNYDNYYKKYLKYKMKYLQLKKSEIN